MASAPDIVQPLADVEADDVHQRSRAQCQQREDDVERRVVREMRPRSLAHEENVAGGKIEDGREVGKIAGPVSPGGHEAGEVSEGALAPDIEAAFTRIAGRKLEHRECKRRIETEPRADPDDDGTRAGRSCGGDPAQTDAGNHIKQNQVAEAEHALWAIWIFYFGNGDARGGDGDSVLRVDLRVRVSQSCSPGLGSNFEPQERESGITLPRIRCKLKVFWRTPLRLRQARFGSAYDRSRISAGCSHRGGERQEK